MTKHRRLVSAVLAALLVLTLVPVEGIGGWLPMAYAVTQADIDALKGDASELASQRSDIKSQLAELKNQRSSALKQLELLDQQIALTEREIKNTEDQISGYEALLSQTAYELEENRREEAEQYALFCERARVMEEAGTTSYWSVLFKATDFSDLLSRLSDVQEVMDYDQGVLDGLRQLRAEIEAKQAEQEELKAGTEAAKVTLEEKKADLDVQRKEANALVAQIQANVDEYEAELKEVEAERERIQKEIVEKSNELARQYAEQYAQWSANSSGYIWPVTSSKRITSPMGGRNTGIPGASTNHKGVDIGGVGYTSSVLATKAGVVITAKYSSSYGNYVVISHGSGNTTLYAHMSSISSGIKEGVVVSQGQVIGITGSTGIARGAHLHYEVTENGSRIDPLSVLPGWIKAY